MNFRLIAKVTFLLVALTATVFAVVQLNTGHMNDFWTSLGIGKKTHSLNWCNDRLISFTGTKDAVTWTLKEENRKWVIVKDSSDTKTLEYLDIEKWLAKYCILDIVVEKVDALDMKVTPIALATFNDETKTRIFKLGDQKLYQINHVIFTSTELEQGLAELYALLKI